MRDQGKIAAEIEEIGAARGRMPPGPSPEIAADIALIERAATLLRRNMTKRRLAKAALKELQLEIDISAIEVIDALEDGSDQQEEVTVGIVGERLATDPSRASRMVAEAVKAGVVQRVASQSDGRRIMLRLTDRGRQAQALVHDYKRAAFQRFMMDWPAADVRNFARLFARFAGLVDDERRKRDW